MTLLKIELSAAILAKSAKRLGVEIHPIAFDAMPCYGGLTGAPNQSGSFNREERDLSGETAKVAISRSSPKADNRPTTRMGWTGRAPPNGSQSARGLVSRRSTTTPRTTTLHAVTAIKTALILNHSCPLCAVILGDRNGTVHVVDKR